MLFGSIQKSSQKWFGIWKKTDNMILKTRYPEKANMWKNVIFKQLAATTGDPIYKYTCSLYKYIYLI